MVLPPGPMMMGQPPDHAAIFIENGSENTRREYTPGKFKREIRSQAGTVRIKGVSLASGLYTYNGIAVTGTRSIVTLDGVRMHLGVTRETADQAVGGAATFVGSGAVLNIRNSELTVDGAQRYVTNTSGDAKLVVNNSHVTQTGSNHFTTQLKEPFSNNALLISGIARANMSTGSSHTYYFNSTVTTEGWAALSTDASTGPGLDLYAYNTRAVAQHGGYGTYADFGCRVWLYGSTLESAEVGAIISKSGQITVADGASAPADVTLYDLGATTSAGSQITGGRNAVMIHAPDMRGEGRAAADSGTLSVINSTLATDRQFKSTRDYAVHISKATDAYISYISGAALLIKSTSATINFERAQIESYSGVAVLTVLNSDRMGNFLKSESDGALVRPIAISMKDMSVSGDIKHMDYQRLMTLKLDHASLKGAVVSGTVEDWNHLWSGFESKDTGWVQNATWNTFYGVRMTLLAGSTWEVTGASLLSALHLEDGATVKGRVQVDGKEVVLTPGTTYTGRIVVLPAQS